MRIDQRGSLTGEMGCSHDCARTYFLHLGEYVLVSRQLAVQTEEFFLFLRHFLQR
jgi:hypothetical protein